MSDARHARTLVMRHGRDATSAQVLEPGFLWWFDPTDDALVAHVDTGGAWVVAGAPICAPDALPGVTARFLEAARAAGRRAVFIAVEDEPLDAMGLTGVYIGEQPVWDPARWSERLRRKRSLKEQLRRARAKGVVVREVPQPEVTDPDSPLRQQAAGIIDGWLSTRKVAPLGFLVQVAPFSVPEIRRYFAAEIDGELVGLLVAVPIYARSGWLVQHILRAPTAPNGTAERMVDAAMAAFAEEGSDYVTLGVAPLAGPVGRELAMVRKLSSRVYSFEGLRAFKDKLQPIRWDPVYVGVPDGVAPARAVYDVLLAFATGGPVRFVLRTLLRVPDLFLRLMIGLLLPWTVLLALAPTSTWFPSPTVHLGWVLFDVGLAVLLLTLIQRWRGRLATLLAALVSADAVVTALSVVQWNLPRASGGQLVMLAVAVLGPTVAAVLLWRACLQRARWRVPARA